MCRHIARPLGHILSGFRVNQIKLILLLTITFGSDTSYANLRMSSPSQTTYKCPLRVKQLTNVLSESNSVCSFSLMRTVLSREATNTNCIVLVRTRVGSEHTICCTLLENANQDTTNAIIQ
jgi:hypothetical protein